MTRSASGEKKIELEHNVYWFGADFGVEKRTKNDFFDPEKRQKYRWHRSLR